MGTKRKLSPKISEIVSGCQTGPFLDAFAGMSSVGSVIGPSREIWTNDLQAFSNLVSAALFCSSDWPPSRQRARGDILEIFTKNFIALAGAHGNQLEQEARAVASRDHVKLRELFEAAAAATEFGSRQTNSAYDLFTKRYACLYFSTAQAIEIDSVRRAADHLLEHKQLTGDEHRWLILALALAMNRCTTSTGHFAQPLAPKASNASRVANQRSRSILLEALNALDELRPLGSKKWRSANRVYRSSAADLLSFLAEAETCPAVVYADPPYTDDQYSRYYHLYETLVLYDYPQCAGRGRYRPDRATSDFCLPSRVHIAFDALIRAASETGSDLVISYPESGLMINSRAELTTMIQRHYGKEPQVINICHSHSTMGGSKGPASAQVIESIYKVAA
jgi:adenine-specific DNA-methyltransferase